MDIIYIEQLSVLTTIGIYKWEQKIKQELLLDIAIGLNNRQTGKNDQFEFCLDYVCISQVVTHYIKTHNFNLLERVAQKVADIILNKFNSPWVRIKVCKQKTIVNAKKISIIIERRKII